MTVAEHELLAAPELQEEPSDHCYVILQNHGPAEGGWGPAGLVLPNGVMGVMVYTGSSEKTIHKLELFAERLAIDTGKPTILARYSVRETVFAAGDSS